MRYTYGNAGRNWTMSGAMLRYESVNALSRYMFALRGNTRMVTPSNRTGGLSSKMTSTSRSAVLNFGFAMPHSPVRRFRPKRQPLCRSSCPFEYPGHESLDESLVARLRQGAIEQLILVQRGPGEAVGKLPGIIDATVDLHQPADPADMRARAGLTRKPQHLAELGSLVGR